MPDDMSIVGWIFERLEPIAGAKCRCINGNCPPHVGRACGGPGENYLRVPAGFGQEEYCFHTCDSCLKEHLKRLGEGSHYSPSILIEIYGDQAYYESVKLTAEAVLLGKLADAKVLAKTTILLMEAGYHKYQRKGAVDVEPRGPVQ